MIAKRFIFLFGFLMIVTLSSHCQSGHYDIAYLDVDSIYRTPKEKLKYYELKTDFEKIWLDTINCYTKDYRVNPKYPDNLDFFRIVNYKVDNILHSDSYDTVAVLVSLHSGFINKDGSLDAKAQLTESVIMKAVIDKEGSWHFDCEMNNFGVYATGANEIENSSKKLREMVISSGCFDRNKKINPNYLKDLFTKELP